METSKHEIRLIGAGWKSVSMIDVHGSIVFVLWLCGCNLKCPFCHNWRLASWDKEKCKILDIEELIDSLTASKNLIDYFHVTGGEPLIQWSELYKLLEIVKDLGINNSVNTNLTIVKPLEYMIKKELIDHIATDLKIPPEELFGLPSEAVNILWKLYLQGIKTVDEYGVLLELRIPVAKNIPLKVYSQYIDEVLNMLKNDRFYVVIQPLLGPPVTTPRDLGWCEKYCNPGDNLLHEVAEIVRDHGVTRVYVKQYIRT